MTPMMQQYLGIKADHPERYCFTAWVTFMSFFRRCKSRLRPAGYNADRSGTHRHRTHSMCGVPYHSADGYLAQLVKLGRSVAICEQIGDPATSKGPVERQVQRIVTPGTLTDDALLKPKPTVRSRRSSLPAKPSAWPCSIFPQRNCSYSSYLHQTRCSMGLPRCGRQRFCYPSVTQVIGSSRYPVSLQSLVWTMPAINRNRLPRCSASISITMCPWLPA